MPQNAKTSVNYIATDVYTEAKKRIRHIINTFDKIFVCFSGGKDSLAVLHLVEEVYQELNINDKINVIFRDEEVIPDDIIDFVLWHTAQPQYRFYYYAVQLYSQKFILGQTYSYIQWDENRSWLRPKPDFAITCPGVIFDQYTMDAFCAKDHKGKLAFINGIRADESLVRFQSCMNKKNENYIAATKTPNVKLCKPIYDWSEKDIFKYFYDKKIKYCPVYDMQMWNRQPLRVATPLHAESAKMFKKLKTLYPVFYEQVIDIFPEMLEQERYWQELDRYGIIYTYPKSWSGIFQYIKDKIDDPKLRKLAFKRVFECIKTRENHLKANRYKDNYGGYPILYVFKQIIGGQFKRSIQPCKSPSKDELLYEKA